jgi:hypothetical protein
MKKFILTIAGGGSTYTPGIVKSLLMNKEQFKLEELRMYDLDPERQNRVAVIVREVIKEMPKFYSENDFNDSGLTYLGAGLYGAGFVGLNNVSDMFNTFHDVEGSMSSAMTPSSTSGFGGVLPEEGAIVIDISGMNRVIAIDKENLQVTVEAGIIWEQLQRQLKKEGLDLILYPSSLPSSSPAAIPSHT